MKRIALVLVFAVMLGLCACGQEEAPTEPILEPVILNVVQNWYGWEPPENYERPHLTIQGVDVGNRVHHQLCDGCYWAMITIDAIDDEAVTVQFIARGLGRKDYSGNELDGWNAVIPYDEAYEITSPSKELGVSFTYTFTKNTNL